MTRCDLCGIREMFLQRYNKHLLCTECYSDIRHNDTLLNWFHNDRCNCCGMVEGLRVKTSTGQIISVGNLKKIIWDGVEIKICSICLPHVLGKERVYLTYLFGKIDFV